MGGYLRFVRDNAPWLAAGGLLTFGSSFGQTYFISIFAGEIRAEFGLSHGEWGAIYALGTLVSASLMFCVGGLADGYRTRTLAIWNLGVFAAICLAMAAVPAAWLLAVVIFGLRFCGQGMMSHLAAVSTGRWFSAARGRAISVVSMGYSLGEALLPVVFVALMAAFGWRQAWVVAALILLAYVPLMRRLLRAERHPRGQAADDGGTGMLGRHWARGEALRHWLFWACVPGLLAQPVFGTAFFFQQVHLVETKGWTLAGFVALFPIYTAASLTALILGGGLVDRLGAGRVMPLYLLPLVAGLCAISLSDSLWVAGAGMVMIGATQGLSAAVMGAFWPEYYGTRNLGAIRAVAMSLMVFASALGPAGTGALIDLGVSYDVQLRGMAAAALGGCVLYFWAFSRARPLLVSAAA